MDNQSTTPSLSIKRTAAALVAISVLGAGGAMIVHQNYAGANSAPVIPAAVAQVPASAAPQMTLPDFSEIAARNSPAVVNISVTGSTKVSLDNSQAGTDDYGTDPFFEFFRRFQGPQGGQRSRDVPTHGLGSGFIVSADGIIMTNAHVVRDAREVTVKLNDRREFRAKVLGTDLKTDIAVLKIDANHLPVVPLGHSNDLKVGEWVLAIGSPYGFDSTVTAGVVSAKGRSLPDDSNVPFIQTDVAVNPGNSGGPLFNTRGEVVGINSQIYSQTGGFQGLSFAIPIDLAGRIKDQIVATGKASHAKLGVTVQEVNQGFADSFKLATPEGALVANVERGSPADKAGLKSGDVIRKMNGQRIIASGDLPAMVGVALPGDKINLDVWRDGKIVTLSATLGNAADKVADVAQNNGASGKVRLGLALRPLQSEEKREAGISAGLLVEDAGGAAANAGVQPGDVLLSVNGHPVNTVEQVRDVVDKSAKSVALLIQRGPDKIFIPVRLG
ncbi:MULTISPECIES: DegQ family serine endoprotease [unclassified Janthinobacterium]|uniref:DegQ family serine endoprotease n=1 Tax=unclassified Janthinobacterium TaxID=2610881 RepID=UPI00161D342B|nr:MULTISPECIES: DegQ family serine endoprotease [unclassified Janthinobacterium]MBB5367403.1 serine protease Do [Janthinobacterium sp. K2C7]MBB5380119.1 serine protease Do [Janthinobacterium sp. K2Li3]MBB5385785.1 serine protease Do [Janthinobacterium sp. K2E3]